MFKNDKKGINRVCETLICYAAIVIDPFARNHRRYYNINMCIVTILMSWGNMVLICSYGSVDVSTKLEGTICCYNDTKMG